MFPVHAAALATGAKSFRDNPLIGSADLNRRGLHVARVELAARMAERRRRHLRRLAPPQFADAIDRDGVAVVRNLLDDEAFARLRQEAEDGAYPAREMRQGGTVTRFITLPPELLDSRPALKAFVADPIFQGLLRYAGSFDHEPIVNIHTVMAGPGLKRKDPQTDLHADTFHATAKAWFFLRDVEPEDGPFRYVPGSHRLTPERLEWERRTSIAASEASDFVHSRGSFRASEEEILAMGYPPPVDFAVPANTLVVADTHGFHARAVSHRRSTRVSIYGSLRGSPFMPAASLDVFRLPGLRGRKTQTLDLARGLQSRITGVAEGQPLVGLAKAGDPPVRHPRRKE